LGVREENRPFLNATASSRYDDARAALAAGELARCIELCESAAARTHDSDSVRSLALHAEALRRADRPEEAIRLIRESAPSGKTRAHEELQAILGRSLVDVGDLPAAEAVLRRALSEARTEAGRELIALSLAMIDYNRCRFGEVAALLELVQERDTIRYVRRLGFQGWIAVHQEDYDAADRYFDAALEVLGRLPRDIAQEASLLCISAANALERLDLDRWRRFRERSEALGPLPVGLRFERFYLSWASSIAAEIDGQPDVALRHAHDLVDPQYPPVIRVLGMCRRAAILVRYEERISYRDLVDSIDKHYQALDLRNLRIPQHSQEMHVFNAAAEAFALAGNHARAQAVLDDLASCTIPETPWKTNRVEAAQRSYVLGLIADARGESLVARRYYIESLRAFRRVGFHLQGIIVAQRLVEMSADAELVAYVKSVLPRVGRDSWVRRRFARSVATQEELAQTPLSRAEREVLDLLLAGTSTREIALRRGRSEKTVRNTISSLLKTFGVKNRHELVVERMRR
jgi:DNA-binding CsgD family transcriptional regulator/predicted negative regulator of RcsB-dependent stress response